MLYTLTGVGTRSGEREANLGQALDECSFVKVANLYRLIDSDTINVLVPYDPATFDTLRDEILNGDRRKPGFIRDWIRRARPHSVGVYRPRPDSPNWCFIQPVYFGKPLDSNNDADWFICLPDATYDENLGLQFPDDWPIFA
jgi:hypothetical protein